MTDQASHPHTPDSPPRRSRRSPSDSPPRRRRSRTPPRYELVPCYLHQCVCADTATQNYACHSHVHNYTLIQFCVECCYSASLTTLPSNTRTQATPLLQPLWGQTRRRCDVWPTPSVSVVLCSTPLFVWYWLPDRLWLASGCTPSV